jgi:hypothetical protein
MKSHRRDSFVFEAKESAKDRDYRHGVKALRHIGKGLEKDAVRPSHDHRAVPFGLQFSGIPRGKPRGAHLQVIAI